VLEELASSPSPEAPGPLGRKEQEQLALGQELAAQDPQTARPWSTVQPSPDSDCPEDTQILSLADLDERTPGELQRETGGEGGTLSNFGRVCNFIMAPSKQL